MTRGTVLALVVTLLAACVATEKQVTQLQVRAAVVDANIATLPPRVRAALERGEVWQGANETEVFLARGAPRIWWNTQAGSRWCRVLVHSSLVDPSRADLAVTTCDGIVVALATLGPSLPCWRIADVGPRIVRQVDYFERLPYLRQWQIVAGILERGQTAADVDIAFGAPYSTGFEEREDGKRADKLVFLDHGGNAYGLNITMTNGRVVAWSMPAEQILTPEAQQRRLDALEQRLTTRIAELEANMKRMHDETVRQFGDVMRSKDSFLSTLASGLAAAASVAAGQALAPREVETTTSSEDEESSTGSIKVDQSKPGTTTIELDQTQRRSTKSKTTKKRKR
jgi:hypothetical protein